MGTHLRDMRIGAYQGMDRCATPWGLSLGSVFLLAFHFLLTCCTAGWVFTTQKCVEVHLSINTFVSMDWIFLVVAFQSIGHLVAQ